MKPIESMTVEEVIDELAERTGWTSDTQSVGVGFGVWLHTSGEESPDHPIAFTLDSAASAMPEEFHTILVRRFPNAPRWGAWANNDKEGRCVSADDEIFCRLKLALTCWRAKEGKA